MVWIWCKWLLAIAKTGMSLNIYIKAYTKNRIGWFGSVIKWRHGYKMRAYWKVLIKEVLMINVVIKEVLIKEVVMKKVDMKKSAYERSV